jgi:hypothetical protein
VLVVDPFAGVTEEVRDALAGVPECERALLELRLSWPALGEREALIAARLRVFVLTWDPFGWMRDRGAAWATATGDGDSYEVVLYLTLHDAERRARETGRTLADVIGELAGSVLAVGAAHEELLVSGAYPQLVFAGEVPGLLSELGSEHGLPAAEIELAPSGWEPIGLGAIQDLAQERYGPVKSGPLPGATRPGDRTDAGLSGMRGRTVRLSRGTGRAAHGDVRRARRAGATDHHRAARTRRRATARAGTRSWAAPRCSQSRRSVCRSGC